MQIAEKRLKKKLNEMFEAAVRARYELVMPLFFFLRTMLEY